MAAAYFVPCSGQRWAISTGNLLGRAAGPGIRLAVIGLGVLHFVAGNFVGGMWLGLIGLFLSSAAQGSYQQVLARQVLQGEPLRRFMNPEPIVVPRALDLQHWVDDYVFRHHHKTYPVASNGHVQGVISTDSLSQYPRGEWPRHTVAEIMRQDLEAISLPSDADALQALEQMQRSGSSRLLVMDSGRLAGIISLKDLLRFLQLKLELEGENDLGAPDPRRQDPDRAKLAKHQYPALSD